MRRLPQPLVCTFIYCLPVGKMSKDISDSEDKETPLSKKLEEFGDQLCEVGLRMKAESAS